MPAEAGRGSVRAEAGRVSVPAKRALIALTALALGCAGAPLTVFLPGERVECLFEVMGNVIVEGPFDAGDDEEGGAREAMLEGIRLEVGRETVGSGADAVMVRELLYQTDPAVIENDTPQIVAAEGMLLRFVDPGCLPSE